MAINIQNNYGPIFDFSKMEKDTPQNVYNIQGDFVQGDKHVYPEATTVTHNHFSGSQPSSVDPDEPLSYYITDADLLRQVTSTAEQRCMKADNVKKLIYDPLVEKGYSEGMLRSSEFLKTLKAHLVKMPNIEVDALQRAFRENKK